VGSAPLGTIFNTTGLSLFPSGEMIALIGGRDSLILHRVYVSLLCLYQRLFFLALTLKSFFEISSTFRI